VNNIKLLIYLLNNRIEAKTKKEGIALCRYRLCRTRHSLDCSDIHLRILVLETRAKRRLPYNREQVQKSRPTRDDNLSKQDEWSLHESIAIPEAKVILLLRSLEIVAHLRTL
jgi:hypothetical protein